jgi:hypothetical protein
MAGPASYATRDDVAANLPTVDEAAEGPTWDFFAGLVSRAIDLVTDRYFWTEGPTIKYFDGEGGRWLTLRKHDFYSVTKLRVALYENADPAGGSWIQLIGDGVTPPSNFYLEPGNPDYIAGSTTLRKPYSTIVIPELPIQANFNGILVFTQGRRTVELTASWGWPAVPSDIKDLTVKATTKMWKQREQWWGRNSSQPDMTLTPASVADRVFDYQDLGLIATYRRGANIL